MPAPETDPGSLLQPLSDADIEEFARLLGADWAPDTTMDVEQLDGFLAGLICSPRMVMPSAYVPEIFGGEPQFPDLATTQRFYGLLMRRNNQIAEALNAPIERLDDPRAYVPLLLDWSPDGEIARSVAASGETPPLPLAGELTKAPSSSRNRWRRSCRSCPRTTMPGPLPARPPARRTTATCSSATR